MSWQLYSWKFRVKSPLHIGFHKLNHLSRTRPYIPAKLIWASLTAKLTPMLNLKVEKPYEAVGNFLKKAFRFSYLYPYAESRLYLPKYTADKGLMFGDLTQNAFEKKFITSMASAAIDANSFSAEEGLFHELEFINPYTINGEEYTGEAVFMKGVLWVRELLEEGLTIGIKDGKVSICNLADRFQVGGERKYGFGLLELEKESFTQADDLGEFDTKWPEENEKDEEKKEVCLTLKKGSAIWSHVVHSDNLNIKGSVELLVGRDWEAGKGAGGSLNSQGLCWSPGSVLNSDETFKISEAGTWER